MASSSPDRDEFVELITRHRAALYGYVLALVQNSSDAEDLVQQTCLILWRKFNQYDRDGNFAGWACRTAQFEVLNFLKSKRRNRVTLSDELLGGLAAAASETSDDATDRSEALAGCVRQLTENDRQLLDLCYGSAGSFKSAATQIGRPVDSVYKSLSRIRLRLYHCIHSRLASGKGSS